MQDLNTIYFHYFKILNTAIFLHLFILFKYYPLLPQSSIYIKYCLLIYFFNCISRTSTSQSIIRHFIHRFIEFLFINSILCQCRYFTFPANILQCIYKRLCCLSISCFTSGTIYCSCYCGKSVISAIKSIG